MARKRFWIAGAAVVAAVAAFPLSQPGQASAQPTRTPIVQVSGEKPQTRLQPQALNRDGRAVRVVYPSPIAAK
jgi:hypothetical protein